MKGMMVVAAVVAALLIFGGAAVAEQAGYREFAKRGADDVAEGGHRGGHHGNEPATATDGQDSKGKALFESKCSACHGLDRPLGKTRDRDGWTATVKRMQQNNGCPITDSEAREIIDHLVKIRGKNTPGS